MTREQLAKALRRAAHGVSPIEDEPWELWPDQVKEQWLRVADAAVEHAVPAAPDDVLREVASFVGDFVEPHHAAIVTRRLDEAGLLVTPERLARELEATARAIPVDFWSTYGRIPRDGVEGVRQWLIERAARIRQRMEM